MQGSFVAAMIIPGFAELVMAPSLYPNSLRLPINSIKVQTVRQT
jgi:hypothetical protein